MRVRLAAAVLAALTLALPAAAQDPVQILTGAVEQMARNHGDVRDYTMLLSSGDDSAWVYVHQEDGDWEVETRDGPLMSTLLSAAVVWPRLGNPDELGIEPDDDEAVRYLGTETLGGRTAHVLSLNFGDMTEEEADSSLLYVDAQTRQILRMHVAGSMEDGPGAMPIGPQRMSATMDMADYRETDGLTIPRRVGFAIRLDMSELSAEDQQEMQAELDELRAEMKGEDVAEFAEFLEMIELFGRLLVEGGIEMEATIAAVHVNSGPPAWLEEDEDDDFDEDDDEDDDEDEDEEDPA